jgi:hypothetical protein
VKEGSDGAHAGTAVSCGRTCEAYGSFTVGAVLDGGETSLELDLGNVPGVPKGFIDR